MQRKGMLSLLVCLFTFSILSAHEKHKPKTAVQNTAAKTTDSLIVSSQSEDTLPYRMPAMKDALFEHLHNKIVHFPIAFGLGAALLFILAKRWPELHKAGLLSAFLGAIFAVAAYFSGQAQEGAFMETPKEWLAELHEKIGIATAVSLWVLVFFGFWKPLKKYAWLWGLVVTGLALIGSFYGGLLAHG
ncbi:MAG: hypothetical protein L0196_08615 [candidate division Zixibacteria bacterium]|nr:hypothetical protein [candidate division Zixibacteria bacterium]